MIFDVRALADRPLQFLHLQYQAGRAVWSLSGGQSLSADVATIPTSNASVVPVGDANLETRPMTENAPLKIVKPERVPGEVQVEAAAQPLPASRRC